MMVGRRLRDLSRIVAPRQRTAVPARPSLEGLPEKFYWRPLASTLVNRKPFGEHVEGLSHCGAVWIFSGVAPSRRPGFRFTQQTDDFEDSALGGAIGRTPLLPKCL